MTASECPICERISYVKRTGSFFNVSFKIALVEDSYKSNGFRGRLTGRAVKFKYCPICGREFSKASLYVKRQVMKSDKYSKV